MLDMRPIKGILVMIWAIKMTYLLGGGSGGALGRFLLRAMRLLLDPGVQGRSHRLLPVCSACMDLASRLGRRLYTTTVSAARSPMNCMMRLVFGCAGDERIGGKALRIRFIAWGGTEQAAEEGRTSVASGDASGWEPCWKCVGTKGLW